MKKHVKTIIVGFLLGVVLVGVVIMGCVSVQNHKASEKALEAVIELKQEALKAHREIPSMDVATARVYLDKLENEMMKAERESRDTDSEQFERVLGEVNDILVSLHPYVRETPHIQTSPKTKLPSEKGKTQFF